VASEIVSFLKNGPEGAQAGYSTVLVTTVIAHKGGHETAHLENFGIAVSLALVCEP
jgi:hypothetical protein